MKGFICCLIASIFYLALADVKNTDDSLAVATAKNNVTKPKRDAPLLSSVYHGPSYKYLPPSSVSSTYDYYPVKVGTNNGLSGGHISGIGGAYRPGSIGQGHRHHGFYSSGNRNMGTFHSLANEPASNYGNGYRGYANPSSNHYGGQSSTQFFRSGFKGGYESGANFGHGDYTNSRPHSFGITNGNSVGTNVGADGGYYYTRGLGGSISSPASFGIETGEGISNSLALSAHEEHDGDHVHNGAEKHVYVVSNTPAGLSNSYIPPVHQHDVPSHSFVQPVSATGASFNTNYHSQATSGSVKGPAYAAGHKGLGYYSFMANKPQVLRSGISGSSFQQPSYSKAPFKPSTFLGAKFEGSNDALSQQYLPSLGGGSDTTDYDYSIPSETSINYQEPSHHQSVEVQSASVHEPDSSYLSPKNNQDTLFDISVVAPNGNYLPPRDSYGVPYSH